MKDIKMFPTKTMDEYKREIVLKTLARFKGNRTRTAYSLGVAIRTLRNNITIYKEAGFWVAEPGKRGDNHQRQFKKPWSRERDTEVATRWKISDEHILRNVCISGGTIRDAALQTGFPIEKVEFEAKIRGYEFGKRSDTARVD